MEEKSKIDYNLVINCKIVKKLLRRIQWKKLMWYPCPTLTHQAWGCSIAMVHMHHPCSEDEEETLTDALIPHFFAYTNNPKERSSWLPLPPLTASSLLPAVGHWPTHSPLAPALLPALWWKHVLWVRRLYRWVQSVPRGYSITILWRTISSLLGAVLQSRRLVGVTVITV